MGITKPTPIQALAIGPVLEGRDVIAKAETGTGKTLAFGAPMIARVDAARASVLALVLCPTRELSEQVHNVLVRIGAVRDLKVALIVGGEPMQPQVKALQSGSQVVVGTPGRVLDLMGQGFLSFPWTEFVVLDEADKMLEIGFIDDVRKILAGCNEERQTLLFSATFPPQLLSLARDGTRDPVEVATAQGISTVDTIKQYYLEVTEENRARALAVMIDRSAPDAVFLVFCDRRTDVDRLMRRMERERFSVKALHGGYDQAARFRVMSAFRTGEVKCLVATDVASRGLDVLHVTHVINFGVPRDASDYTHRIGRTGRAGRSGTAVTLVGPTNRRNWRALETHVPFEIEELQSPHDLHARVRSRGRDDESSTAEPQEDETPRNGRRGSRRDERSETDAEREGRPRRKPRAEREARPEREERPRRERERDERPEREDRPTRKPRVADKPDPEPPRKQSARGGGHPTFGVGVSDDGGAEKKRKRARTRKSDETRDRKPDRKEDGPTGGKKTGFGTGI
ncbi:MAG: DEAD/DEAH box helicase [bacterium]|nr:DEAD/DEAH box helicase [bacterium]